LSRPGRRQSFQVTEDLTEKASQDTLPEGGDETVHSAIGRPYASAEPVHCVREAATPQHKKDNTQNQDMPRAQSEHAFLRLPD